MVRCFLLAIILTSCAVLPEIAEITTMASEIEKEALDKEAEVHIDIHSKKESEMQK